MFGTFRINQLATIALLFLFAFAVKAQDASDIQVIYFADLEMEESGYQFQGDFDVIKIPGNVNFESRLKIEYQFGDNLTTELPENRVFRAFSKMTKADDFVGFFQFKIREDKTVRKNCILVSAATEKDLFAMVQQETEGKAYDIKALEVTSPLSLTESYTEVLYNSLHEKINPILDPIEKELIFRESGTITGTDY